LVLTKWSVLIFLIGQVEQKVSLSKGVGGKKDYISQMKARVGPKALREVKILTGKPTKCLPKRWQHC